MPPDPRTRSPYWLALPSSARPSKSSTAAPTASARIQRNGTRHHAAARQIPDPAAAEPVRPVEVRQRVVRVEIALIALDDETRVWHIRLAAAGGASRVSRAGVLRAREGVRRG